MCWLTKLAVVLAVTTCVNASYFDCRRNGIVCENSTACDDNTGNCTCDAGINDGPNCGLATDTIVLDQAMMLMCENSGITVEKSGVKSCYCLDPTYYGTLCENRRAEVTCSGDSLNVTIVPYQPFMGLVFVKDNMTDTACAFNESTDGDGVVSYFANLGVDSGCSIQTTMDSANTTTYSVDVKLQASSTFVTSGDMVVTASCSYSNSSMTAVDGGVGTVSVDDPANFTKDTTETKYDPVQFAVLRRDGSAVTPPLFLGDKLMKRFELADKKLYDSFVLETCTAVNGPNAPVRIREITIQNGCPTTIGRSIIEGDIMYDMSIPRIMVNFTAFRFSNSPIVSFECSVRVCRPTETCIQPTCTANNIGRRRRSAENPEEFNVVDTIAVRDPYNPEEFVPDIYPSSELRPEIHHPDHNTDHEHQVESQLCAQSNGILIVVIILVVAVVLLLLATTCLTVKVLKSRSQVKAMP
ncbi:EGF-like domain-containing protein 2 [Patella vulgata]|uniref:EGF-like domain-containing protein 2 n=1 Tax=Patella vulgata TaxID=6465 RepID=UPI0024A9B2AC|nr:EGF-like domain-containing protein 2 [Patella vulgata]